MNLSSQPFHPINVAMENCLFDHVTCLVKHAYINGDDDDDDEVKSEHLISHLTSTSTSSLTRAVVIPGAGDVPLDHVKYVLQEGLSVNAVTLSAMLQQRQLTSLMLKCFTRPRKHLMVETLQAWTLWGNTHETPIRQCYMENVLQVVDSLTFVSLFDLCRIKIRKTIGCVDMHRKIDALNDVPDKVKTWLKLESL